MIEIADITAVSDLKIFSLILTDWTPLKERILSLSTSEKSPSGPTIIQIGLSVSFDLSILILSEFKSVNIKSIESFFKKLSNVWGLSIEGTFIRFDCSVASTAIFSKRSLFTFLTTVLSKIIGKNLVTPSN